MLKMRSFREQIQPTALEVTLRRLSKLLAVPRNYEDLSQHVYSRGSPTQNPMHFTMSEGLCGSEGNIEP